MLKACHLVKLQKFGPLGYCWNDTGGSGYAFIELAVMHVWNIHCKYKVH